jgi:hypothetical protein
MSNNSDFIIDGDLASPKNLESLPKDDMFNDLDNLDKISPTSNKKTKDGGKKGILDINPNKDIVKCQPLILKIQQYKTIYPTYLATYGDELDNSNLSKMNYEELKDLIDKIRVTIGILNSGSFIHTGYYGVCNVIETILPRITGVNMDGFTEELTKNPDVHNTLNEIMLEQDMIYIRPEIRLALVTLGCVNTIIARNKFKLTDPVKKSVYDLGKDL